MISHCAFLDRILLLSLRAPLSSPGSCIIRPSTNQADVTSPFRLSAELDTKAAASIPSLDSGGRGVLSPRRGSGAAFGDRQRPRPGRPEADVAPWTWSLARKVYRKATLPRLWPATFTSRFRPGRTRNINLNTT